jgi:hypothetical protein
VAGYRAHMWPRTRLLIALPAITAVVAAGGTAKAQSPSPPPPTSAIAQYVEQVPTSSGGQALGSGTTRAGKLSGKVKQQIVREGGKDAGLLEAVATSSAYGAPAAGAAASRKGRTGKSPSLSRQDVSSALGPLATASDARLIGLGVVMLLVTLAALVGSAVRQRRLRSPAPRPATAAIGSGPAGSPHRDDRRAG